VIKIYEPFKLEESKKFFIQIIDEQEITYFGSCYKRTNSKLSELLQTPTILMNNGTCATHMLADLIKKTRPSVENLIVPNNVYVAAWNSFLFGKNSFKLIPVDASLDTWNYNLDKLELLLQTSDPQKTAVLVVHNIGNIVNVPRLSRQFPEFLFVEDNCEGFTGKYEGFYSGTKSLASSISFYANKIITSGEGGALILNQPELYDFAYKLHSQGQTRERYLHDLLAYNYRMTNLQAALLESQLKLLDEILYIKNKIWSFYDENLDKNKFIRPLNEPQCEPSKWMYAIRAKGMNYRDDIENKIFDFETRPMFHSIAKHQHLSEYSIFEHTNAEILSKEVFMLPSHPNLTEKELTTIVQRVNSI
jgi:perosamine synthetase